jgi:hypothetical protein
MMVCLAFGVLKTGAGNRLPLTVHSSKMEKIKLTRILNDPGPGIRLRQGWPAITPPLLQ